MFNLPSWKTWAVLAGTLVVISWVLYLIYVADVQASEKVALNKPVPKRTVEEATRLCLTQLERGIPDLLGSPELMRGNPTVSFENRSVPVLIEPTRYGLLNAADFLSALTRHYQQNLPHCMMEAGGYTVRDLQALPLSENLLTINLQYKVFWEKKKVQESLLPVTVYLNVENLFGFVQDYVEKQRTTPAVMVSLLEKLSQQHQVQVQVYGLGDVVVYKLWDPTTAEAAGQKPPEHALYFAAKYPWQKPVRGAKLLTAEKINAPLPVQFVQGSFWIVP